ncbi:Teichoic acid translocation permease protein TagG [Nocardioides aquaticus]|uniref:Transport permease protein n=2 Tax=Actinomycetes TaxID=1760 RepID=A0ABX8EM06_9ACTN|nr:ABC transporter permease [Nocardioides aquaticus]QVT80920.1 Teichoic acid translocation permease protein TagG [Nocardioides aquaticus]
MTDVVTPHAASEDEPGGARVVEAPLRPPSDTGGLLEVFRRRYLLKLLVKREISARYQGSFLGLIWSYINPLTQFCIYFFIMQIVIGRGRTENFAVHVFCGLIVVHFFVETFNAGTRSIVRNKSLVQKMAVPREMFPVASMLVSLFHVVPQLVILVVVSLLYGWTPDPAGIGALFLSLGIVMVLGTALALLFSTANVFFRDFSSAVNILTNFTRFGVPMIYPYTLVPERFGAAAEFYLWNPMANAVLLVQRGFWIGTTTDPEEFARTELPPNLFELGLWSLLGSLVLLVIAQRVFSRLEQRIPERL